MISQSRIHSILEATANTIICYFIGVGAQRVIFPLFGIFINPEDNFAIAGLFTIVSFVRSYILRRVFNWLHVEHHEKRINKFSAQLLQHRYAQHFSDFGCNHD